MRRVPSDRLFTYISVGGVQVILKLGNRLAPVWKCRTLLVNRRLECLQRRRVSLIAKRRFETGNVRRHRFILSVQGIKRLVDTGHTIIHLRLK